MTTSQAMMRLGTAILALLVISQPASAQVTTTVHTTSLPEKLILPENANTFLYLEGETFTEGDVWPNPEHKARTRFRMAQEPNDTWWGANRAPDGTRMAMRGADLNQPWHRLNWDVSDASLEPGLYDAHARVMVSSNGGCDLAFTLGDELPERPVSNNKPYINWVQAGTVEISAETRKVQLHVRTRLAAVRVDTVLLVKVQPIVINASFNRLDITPPDWQKGDGLVFAKDTATLGFSSDAPSHIRNVQAAIRTRSDAPLVFERLAPQADGTWHLALRQPGWYDLHVKATLESGKEIVRNTRVAVLGKPIPEAWREKSVFGLWNVHGDTALIRLAGARWNRRMTSFRDITEEQAAAPAPTEPGPAPYAERDGLAEVGVHAFGMPLWTMRLPEKYRMPGFGNPFYPAKDWADVVRCIAAHARMRAQPRFFSMYNEPLAYWKGTHAELVDYARAVHAGLKSVNPDYQVGGPGLYSIRIGDLEKLAQAGILDVLDFIDVHAYVGGTPPETDFLSNLVELNDWLRDKGQTDKPVILTEFGWTAADGTWQPSVDRWTQAQYVARSLALGWSQGIDAMIYFVLDFRNSNAGEAAFSLMDAQNRPEPGYVSFSAVSKWFAASTPIGHYTLSPRTHMVVGHRDDKLQIGLWCTQGTETIQLPFSILRAVDMFGAPIETENNALTVSPDPCYLEVAADGATTLPLLPEVSTTDLRQVALQATEGTIHWPLEGMPDNQAQLRDGRYSAFCRVDGLWRLLPVTLVAPAHLQHVALQWPAGAPHPQVQATVQSNLQKETQNISLWLSEKPETRTVIELPPQSRREIHFNITDAILGQRRKSTVVLEGPDGQTLKHELEWTALCAMPAADADAWADFTDWAPFGTLANSNAFDDCRAKLRMTYAPSGLAIDVRVTDDEHHQTQLPDDPMAAWSHDSLQIGFDMDILKPWTAGFAGGESGSGTLSGHRVFEFTVAGRADGSTTNGIAFLHRSYDDNLPANTVRSNVRVTVVREANVTCYTLHFPWSELGVAQPLCAGDVFGFSLAVNDVDFGRKAKRHGLRLHDGIVNDKNAKNYGPVWLR